MVLEGNMNFNMIAELKEVTFLRNELENKNNMINTMLEMLKSTFNKGRENHIETTASNSVEPKSYLSDVSTNGKLHEIIDEWNNEIKSVSSKSNHASNNNFNCSSSVVIDDDDNYNKNGLIIDDNDNYSNFECDDIFMPPANQHFVTIQRNKRVDKI